ncbi:MAG: hypothetical protein R2712_18300 [Vicinamibacterales bacterium]
MQQLAAVQLAQHLQHARDLASHPRLGPGPPGAGEVAAQVSVAGELEDEAVVDLALVTPEREPVVHLDRAAMALQQLSEVGLADPALDAAAHLDAHLAGQGAGRALDPRGVHLAEAALPHETPHPITAARVYAREHLSRRQQLGADDRRAPPGSARVVAEERPRRVRDLVGTALQSTVGLAVQGAARFERGRLSPGASRFSNVVRVRLVAEGETSR